MTDLEPLRALPGVRSRAQEVADYLAELIETRLSPGERLGTKESVRKLTGVSVSTVNEAIRLLAERGLISMRPGPRGGIFAADPGPVVKVGQLLLQVRDDPQRYSEAGAIRDALEPLIAADAARLRSDDDIGELTAILADMERSEDRIDDFMRADLALHRRIAVITDRVLLSNLYLMVLQLQVEQLRSAVTSRLPPASHTHERLVIHQDLVAAIAGADADAATAAAHRHAQHSEPVDDRRPDQI